MKKITCEDCGKTTKPTKLYGERVLSLCKKCTIKHIEKESKKMYLESTQKLTIEERLTAIEGLTYDILHMI